MWHHVNGKRFGDDLYFVRSERGTVKIGRSGNMPVRMIALQNAADSRLTLHAQLGGQGWQERVWHKVFWRERLEGEWFKWSRDLELAIQRAVDGDTEGWMMELTPYPPCSLDRMHEDDMGELRLPVCMVRAVSAKQSLRRHDPRLKVAMAA